MARYWRGGRILLVVVLASLALSGCIFRYNSYTIDCTGFGIEIAYFQPTVDNTGAGAELVDVSAVDGAGRVILSNLTPGALPLGLPYPPDGDPFWAMFAGMPPIPWDTAPLYNPITVTFTNPAGGTLTHDVELLRLTGECPGLPFAARTIGIDDGRLNRLDAAAPVAVFPIHYGTGTGLHFYAIGSDGTGTFTLEVTPEMIAAVPELPEENTLIAATPDGAIALYRLTTGEFQVNAGPYVIVFRDLIPTAEYYTP